VIRETDDDEAQAREFIKTGQIDQAIEIYQRVKPESARIFNTIGSLLGDKKGDYESAIVYYKKSLKIQEKVDHHRFFSSFLYLLFKRMAKM